MKATVVTPFKDEPTGIVYKKVGQPYPTENVSKERLELLSNPHPKTKKIYISIEQQADEAPVAEEKPAPKRGRRAPAKKDGE